MRMKKPNKVKVIRIIILSVVAVILLLIFLSYIILHRYINKINLVDSSNVSNTETDMLDGAQKEDEAGVIPEVLPKVEPEDEISDAPDSPADEIQLLEDKIRLNMQENSIPIMYDENVFNILLIGSDTREANDRGRSDSMIIISINKKMKTITATSLLRDIYLQIPDRKSNRINTAYAYGGAELLLKTIKQNFKIDIERYISIDFDSFIHVVDAIDGITLDISEAEIPVINRYVRELNEINGRPEDTDILTEPGTYHLNGIQALSYARNRYVGLDFERTARQRRVLEQIFNNVKNLNLLKLNDLLNTVLPEVTTNLTEGELFSLILSLPTYKGYTLKEWSIPINGSYKFLIIRGLDVIGIDFEKNINELHDRIYGE